MKNLYNSTDTTQGVEPSTQRENYDVAGIKAAVVGDLKNAVLLLNAIQSDPDLVEQLAVFIHGRITNKENKAQQKLFNQ